jgi:diaminopimelate epimerase
MRLHFTKMQGAGNDFVVIDATGGPVELSREQWRWIAHRQFGVGADQILVVERPDPQDGSVDFVYRIFNADGGEVEQCGNGARCFVKFVRDRGLTDKRVIRVRTRSGVIEPRVHDDGRVEVDMGAPVFDIEQVPFSGGGLTPRQLGAAQWWPLVVELPGQPESVRWITAVSMGNPHAVQVVDSVAAAPVLVEGPWIERHPRFPRRVNAGYMEIVSRGHIRLRVYERGAGETLACGTGACAAVVSGIHSGLLDGVVEVDTRGGRLTICWEGGSAPVLMTGPATTVFTADIDVPDHPVLPQ